MKPYGLRAPLRGDVQTDTKNFHAVPSAFVWNSVGENGHGPGAANVGFDHIEWDTDDMTFGSVPGALNFNTHGLYYVAMHQQYSGVAGVASVWQRIILNNDPTATVGSETDQRAGTNGFGLWMESSGIVRAVPGYFVTPYLYTDTPINVEGADRYHLWFAAHWIGSV